MHLYIQNFRFMFTICKKFTTKEPTADMAEVAIKAVETVFDWRAYLKEEFDLDIPYETEETENAES